MKKNITLIVLLSIGLSSISFAQKNIVKFRPLPLAWGSIDFSYERVLSEQSSVAAKIGFMIPLDFTTPYNNYASQNSSSGNGSAYSGFTITKVGIGGFSFLPEYRFYTEKQAPNGFYVAPYLKFWRAAVSLTGKNDTTSATYGMVGSLNIYGAGVGIGYQWIISDIVSIDWNFLGLGVDAYVLGLNFTGADASGGADQIKQKIPNSSLVISANSASLTLPPAVLPAFKCNFSIGVKF